jgi:K+-transporting ATPase ATPase C chain
MQSLIASLRIVLATIAICVVGYAGTILGVAQLITPDTANGHLITNADGTIIGSRQIAQKFTQPGYFWPRPSAVDYNGAGAGGSNKSPTSSDVTDRAVALIAQYGATPENPLPPELAAASGGGLDPHISEHAALYQAARIAGARGLPQSRIETLVRERTVRPGGPLTPGGVVNVLALNLALDSVAPSAMTPPVRDP